MRKYFNLINNNFIVIEVNKDNIQLLQKTISIILYYTNMKISTKINLILSGFFGTSVKLINDFYSRKDLNTKKEIEIL